MSGLIHKSKEEEKKEKLPPIMLFIEGIRYNNAAAKFWASLIDEVMEEYPSCDSVEILASTSEQLNRKHLFPEKVFSEQIRYFLARNTRVLMKELLAEMEVLGPPASVEIRLLSGEKFLYSGELPLDCVDAEILPFLLVWPMEWAGIDNSRWNEEHLEGSFTGEDKIRKKVYEFRFTSSRKHLSEGLYRLSFMITPEVQEA